jgi:hypothetical protein
MLDILNYFYEMLIIDSNEEQTITINHLNFDLMNILLK